MHGGEDEVADVADAERGEQDVVLVPDRVVREEDLVEAPEDEDAEMDGDDERDGDLVDGGLDPVVPSDIDESVVQGKCRCQHNRLNLSHNRKRMVNAMADAQEQ